MTSTESAAINSRLARLEAVIQGVAIGVKELLLLQKRPQSRKVIGGMPIELIDRMNDFIRDHCAVRGDLKVPREALLDEFRRIDASICEVPEVHCTDADLRRMVRACGFKLGSEPEYFRPWGKTVRCFHGLCLTEFVELPGEPQNPQQRPGRHARWQKKGF